MAKWIRKRTVIGGAVCDDDWMVLRDGRSVGRVYLMMTPHDGNLWAWSTYTHPPVSGRACSLEEGLEEIRAGATKRWSSPPYQ